MMGEKTDVCAYRDVLIRRSGPSSPPGATQAAEFLRVRFRSGFFHHDGSVLSLELCAGALDDVAL